MTNKTASGNDEAISRVHRSVLSRDEAKAYVDQLFNNAKPQRKKDVAQMNDLLVQAPGAQIQSPNLQKEAVAQNVASFFEKKAHLSTAQRLYPELLKVANSETVLSKSAPAKPAGKTPSKSQLSGGG